MRQAPSMFKAIDQPGICRRTPNELGRPPRTTNDPDCGARDERRGARSVSARNLVVIGAGVNGLVQPAAGESGRKVLVVERAERVGGCAMTSEIFPGLPGVRRCPLGGPQSGVGARARARAARVAIAAGDALGCVPSVDGQAVTIGGMQARTPRDHAAVSTADADRDPQFRRSVRAVRRGVSSPRWRRSKIDEPSAGNLIAAENRTPLPRARPQEYG